MRSIASLTLWLFVIGTSLILGAGLYESLVVVPFWSVGAPASLAEGNPLLQVHVRAGHVFWQYFTPVLGLITLLAMLTSFGAPPRHLAWRLAATGLMLPAAAHTKEKTIIVALKWQGALQSQHQHSIKPALWSDLCRMLLGWHCLLGIHKFFSCRSKGTSDARSRNWNV